ncbi:transketolase [Paenibacillus radicis (ex Xue et al. 2023)]|uniref:Transketolase n=1 Tax=Paenibacillus radicis (ex Xue et al. 2023) TaxID=2972489 RepID=A0ABT1YC80_9BACL|nr:transketolase [Paenibacillus radicis (ex Xue et al. 2023)]MCR8630522.1 transketolase [Paenibacillus radicis (ex Xue et al. 2023)]
MNTHANELKRKAAQIRMDLLQMIHHAKTGHTGSSLSNTDILTTLYYDVMKLDVNNPKWVERDRFIASKGHAVESLYCILADKGFFPKEELQTFSQFGSRLIGHPNNKIPGVEMNTGALGHGLSVAVGMGLAGKMDGKSYRVFTLMGDGEQAEGSIWEAAMAASHYKLDNVVGIIDRNKLQISGSTEVVMGLEPLEDKWSSFGWHVVPVNGNDVVELSAALHSAPEVSGKPTLLMAYTTKGKGVSFAENVPHWHHHVPSDAELALAIEELSKEAQVVIHE